MEHIIETRSETTRKFLDHIVKKMVKELKLTRSRKTVLVRVTRSELDGQVGATVPLDPIDSYVVLVKPASLKEMGITLAHEMIHVKQLAKGHLKQVNGVNYWCGKRYRKNHSYLDMPWEVEAFSKQELLFRKALKG